LAEASLKAGDTSKASALALIDTSRDILAQSLDKKVFIVVLFQIRTAITLPCT
jgi:hypothetical protein